MPSRIVDLSVPLQNGVASDPPGYEYSIDYVSHRDTFPIWAKRYKGLKITDLPNEEAFALEKVHLTSHNGTHVDAPWHYASTSDSGERMLTIDEIPLEWFFAPGVKLDFRHFQDGYVVTGADIEKELNRIGHKLAPFDIVLINTTAGVRFGKPDYVERGCGMGREATLYLTSRGVRVTGTDAWGWDSPVKFMVQRYEQTGDASHIWEGHKAGRTIGYCHIEKLHNLEALPANGFRVACFPVKLQGGSAGWTRAVAIFD
jgi:kynurenine formamidase